MGNKIKLLTIALFILTVTNKNIIFGKKVIDILCKISSKIIFDNQNYETRTPTTQRGNRITFRL